MGSLWHGNGSYSVAVRGKTKRWNSKQLYGQLDEKDDEITSTSQELEQLKADMAQFELVCCCIFVVHV